MIPFTTSRKWFLYPGGFQCTLLFLSSIVRKIFLLSLIQDTRRWLCSQRIARWSAAAGIKSPCTLPEVSLCVYFLHNLFLLVLLPGAFILIISCLQPSSCPLPCSKPGRIEVTWLPAVIPSLVSLLLVAQMHPPASSSTCEVAVKDFFLRRKRTGMDSKGMAARHNQICRVTQRIIISIPFFVIGSRHVAEHLCVMHTAKIISTDIISLTIKDLHWLLMGKGRQHRNAAPGLSSASIHGAVSCNVKTAPRDWPSDPWELFVDDLRERLRERDRKNPKQMENFREQSTIIPAINLGKYAKLYLGHQVTTL